jgi:hypothetical protein
MSGVQGVAVGKGAVRVRRDPGEPQGPARGVRFRGLRWLQALIAGRSPARRTGNPPTLVGGSGRNTEDQP